ncbi:CheR family methyltransferase [Nitrospira sp. Ecomares 2.1]
MRLFAIDISREMIKRGQDGSFDVSRGLSLHFLNTYFSWQWMEWQIREDVGNMVEFREMNLTGSWLVLLKMDLVIIRTVIANFDMKTKKDILRRI